MTCTHQFVKLMSIDRGFNASATAQASYGAVVGCALCGEVRKVWEDGTIEVIHKGNATKPSSRKTK